MTPWIKPAFASPSQTLCGYFYSLQKLRAKGCSYILIHAVMTMTIVIETYNGQSDKSDHESHNQQAIHIHYALSNNE